MRENGYTDFLPSANQDPWLSTLAHSRDGYVLAVVGGELDIATASTLHRFLQSLLAEQPRIVVETTKLTFTDAIGIGVLLRAAAAAADNDGWIRLAGARPQLRWLLALFANNHLLPDYDSVEEAVGGKPWPAGQGRAVPR